jgi:hypothetical protein
MLRNFTDNINSSASADYFTFLTNRFYRSSDFHIICYLNRLITRPRVRSYGVTSTITLSPGRIRILLTRNLPAMCAKIICPDSICTRKTALGRVSTTLPSSSMVFFCGVFVPKSCGPVEIWVNLPVRSPLLREGGLTNCLIMLPGKFHYVNKFI